MKARRRLLTAILMISAASAGAARAEGIPGGVKGNIIACDFDSVMKKFSAANASVALSEDTGKGGYCARVMLKGGSDDCVILYLSRTLTFAANPAVISMRVKGPRKGSTVTVRLTSESGASYEPLFETRTVENPGEWEDMVFDFTGQTPRSNGYKRITVFLNRGRENKIAGEKWYIDDISVPDDDLSATSLFQRPAEQFPPKPDKMRPWISNSTANPGILPPSRSVDGRWWLFMRGGDGKNSRLGVYTQEVDTFNPLGPWDYYEGNPVIDIKMEGAVDNRGAIDPAPVVGDDGKLYFYYKGQHSDAPGVRKCPSSTVLYATSTDGYHYTHPVVWKEGIGVADTFRDSDGIYYLLVARRLYAFREPDGDFEDSLELPDLINKGGGPDNFDSYSINGGKIRRFEGVDKWFWFYQGSASHDDFPDRFGVAMSDDLLHWTKVTSEQPLFTRGPAGAWDQGAIWAPEVFEHEGMLYMYYKGWGCKGPVNDRDKRYFSEGHSEIGIATCPKEDFLRWCGLL